MLFRSYLVQPIAPGEVAAPGPLAVCGDSFAAISEWERLSKVAQLQYNRSSHQQASPSIRSGFSRRFPLPRLTGRLATLPHPSLSSPPPAASEPLGDQAQKSADGATPRTAPSQMPGRSSLGAELRVEIACDLNLASCRKWLDLRKRAATKAFAFRDGQPVSGPRKRTATRSR